MDVSTMTIPQLPIELYRAIVGHIPSKSDLCALSVTSRAIQPVAESFIYESVESRRRSRTEALCRLVVSCPRIGPLLRSLTIANDERQSSYPALPQFWKNIARALRRMPLLQTLRINDGFSNPNAWILNKCPFSLRELGCDFSLDDALMSFLNSQKCITSIAWTDTHPPRSFVPIPDLQPSAVPCLRVLHTDSPHMAMRLVPARPVTHLWVSNEADALVDEFIPIIASSAGPLLSLRMGFPFQRSVVHECLCALAKHSPGLRSLGFLRPFTQRDEDIIAALAAFKDLRTLVLWNIITPETLKIVESACPSLRTVACLHYSYAYEYIRMPVNPIGTPTPMHDPDYRLWKDV